MIYSVWDHANRVYDYYRTPDTSAETSAPKPSHLKQSTLGLSPDQAAWPLPSSARKVGSGKYPKGFVASKNGGSGLGFLPELNTHNLVLYGALGFAAWYFLRRA